jgi:hypothetical protein
LLWHLQSRQAVREADELRRAGGDAVLYLLALPRTSIAGLLKGLRVIIEPRYTHAAEAISALDLPDDFGDPE